MEASHALLQSVWVLPYREDAALLVAAHAHYMVIYNTCNETETECLIELVRTAQALPISSIKSDNLAITLNDEQIFFYGNDGAKQSFDVKKNARENEAILADIKRTIKMALNAVCVSRDAPVTFNGNYLRLFIDLVKTKHKNPAIKIHNAEPHDVTILTCERDASFMFLLMTMTMKL
jgi:hypothetical protein